MSILQLLWALPCILYIVGYLIGIVNFVCATDLYDKLNEKTNHDFIPFHMGMVFISVISTYTFITNDYVIMVLPNVILAGTLIFFVLQYIVRSLSALNKHFRKKRGKILTTDM